MKIDLLLLAGYPENVISQMESLIQQGRLIHYLQTRHPESHSIRTDNALYIYVQDIKKTYIKRGAPVHKVSFDDRIETACNALGLHSFVSRVQGKSLKSKSEIRISSV